MKMLGSGTELFTWYSAVCYTMFQAAEDSTRFWQHHGNKKSDSLYYLNNENNANTLS